MMKKVLFGMMGAMALTFTACTSDEAVTEINPNFDATKNEVKTSFVFNVNLDGSATRMTAENVQANGANFRGIQDAKLLTFAQEGNDGKILIAPGTATKSFDLGQILAKNQINNVPTEKSHRVLELALPVKTNTLLFYGKAFKDGAATDQGVINGQDGVPTSGVFAAGSDLSAIDFALTKRLKTADKTKFEAIGTAIAAAMTDIMDTEAEATFWWPAIQGAVKDNGEGVMIPVVAADYAGTIAEAQAAANHQATYIDALGNKFTYFYNASLKWYDLGKEYAKQFATPAVEPDLVPLEEILGEAYYKLTKIEQGAVRAGSGAAVARTCTDTYSIISRVFTTTATGERETMAQSLAETINTKIATYFNIPTGDNADNLLTWKALGSYADTDVQNYPENLMLPMGAAQLLVTEDATNKKYTFTYAASSSLEFHMGDAKVDVDALMYPAELMYFGNSPIRTSDVTKEENKYPDGVANWDDENQWDSDWTANQHIVSSTRSVAMMNDVQYGSALLETMVKVNEGDIEDNRDYFFPGEGNAKVTPDFQLTGVLIGGQPGSVDWCYLPKTAPNSKVIYDRVIPFTSNIPVGEYSPSNYTLVLDNYYVPTGEQTAQLPVYVALEFVNKSGADFWGDHNVVRKDGTFYLVGKLDPTATTGVKAVNWPDNDYRNTPPFTADFTGTEIPRVFIQDFVTKAKFAIGKESLKSAFVTVPDLRSAEISLGLSVDINWESGFEFESVLGQTTTATTGGN